MASLQSSPTTTLNLSSAHATTLSDSDFVILTSFDATQTFLKTLDSPIFLLFTCGTSPDTGQVWSPTCAAASAAVVAAYQSISPPHRLAMVQVGTSQEDGDKSPFRTDFDIFLHDIPSLMRYERNNQGYANTSFVLEGKSVGNAALVEFALTEGRSTGVRKKAVDTIRDYASFRTMAKLFEDTAPTYLLFLSGSWPYNNRVWCASCRYREAVVEYAFQKYAAPNAKLIKVIVAQIPAEWNKHNPYKKLNVPHVPYMLVPHLDAFEMLFYQTYRGELDDVQMLQAMFERDAAFQPAASDVLGLN
ncbi:hypothetical protein DYB32_004523 [Aphanomyces invadans]|uniref:Thioredoxin domain-containing protein n=1 Tax=Aphanomyces invadans TaxID=157072 RepID=A0A418AXG6_9STRA|nr:hypothetical protein DYB32_004523 [Aphanomyces invadans]